jgi:hypothetical protein
MGTTDITNTKTNGDVIDETWYNDFRSTIIGNFVPRNASSGAVDNSAPDLGAFIYPWGNLYANGLVINGVAVDFASVTGIPNSIKSGQTRSTSDFPDFIRATGSSNSFTLLASTVNLIVDINTTETTFIDDSIETGLILAPATNNTCLLNEPTATGQYETSYLGEDNTVITIDNAGTEITNRIGQFCLFQTGTEYFLAYIKSATELTNAYRGFLLDSSGNPVNRTVLNNNDVITLLSTGWVFVDIDGVTIDVTYNSPVYDFIEPTSPVTGDYWFNRSEEAWYRYSGTDFVKINRTLVGLVGLDTVNCVASRCFNFNKEFSDYNPLNLQYVNATTLKTDVYDFVINVYGNKVINQNTRYIWDITTNLESGQTETNDTYYFMYITELGQQIISNIKPYNQKGELGGYYHPYNTWRAIGSIANNSTGNFVDYSLSTYEKLPQIRDKTFLLSGTFYRPFSGDIRQVKVKLWSGGSSGIGDREGGGHGGGYAEIPYKLNDLPLFNSLIVGAGGAGSTNNFAGVAGGDTIFNFLITVKGAYRPFRQNSNSYEYGDFMIGGINQGIIVRSAPLDQCPISSEVYAGGTPGQGFVNNSPDLWSGARGGINNISVAAGTQSWNAANSIYGGGGGSCLFSGSGGPFTGGTSIFGGNGGAWSLTLSEDGQIPSGGGAAAVNVVGTSGAGGQGQIIIEYW